MSFFIQASNPHFQYVEKIDEEVLTEAIEAVFPLNTENAILSWNYICVPLSYKYDISYMVEDVLKLIYNLQNYNEGSMVINWLPDTFRCDWTICWGDKHLEIEAQWECTVGHLENILNERNRIKLSIDNFISEWKEVLGIIIKALGESGYDKMTIIGMDELMMQYESIKESGLLYK